MPVFSLKKAQKLPVCDQMYFVLSYLFLRIFCDFFQIFLKNFDFVAFFSLKMAENGPKNDLMKKKFFYDAHNIVTMSCVRY